MDLIYKLNEAISEVGETATETTSASQGAWGETANFNLLDALVVSISAIAVVFLVLILIIFISWLFQRGLETINTSTKILPEPQNKILEEDEDAVAAVMAAIIDFNKQTGKDVRVVSVTKVED